MSTFSNTERGFTFIEIMIALMILTGAMIVLIGLQTAVIQRNLYAENQQRAILFARRIFTAIEHSPDKASATRGLISAYDLLVSFEQTDKKQNPGDEEALNGLQAGIETKEWGPPDSDKKPLIQVVLTVAWGPGANQEMQFAYLSTKPEDDETG